MATTSRVAGQPRKSKPTAASVDKKVNDLSADTTKKLERLTELLNDGWPADYALAAQGYTDIEVRKLLDLPSEGDLTGKMVQEALVKYALRITQRVNVLHYIITSPKANGGLVRTGQELAKLEERLNDLDTFLKGNLQEALKAGSVGGKNGFIRALRKNHSDQEIREALMLIEGMEGYDLNLDDADTFCVLFTEFNSFKKVTEAKLDEHDTEIKTLRKDVDLIESSHREVREEIKSIQYGTFPLAGVVVGSLLGFLTFLWWLNHDWKTGTHTTSTTLKNKIGTSHLTNTLASHSAADHWYWALAAGVGVAAIVIGLSMLFAKNKTDVSASTSSQQSFVRSTTSRIKGKRAAAKAQRENERRNGLNLVSDNSETDDGKTQTLLPVADEENQHQKVM